MGDVSDLFKRALITLHKGTMGKSVQDRKDFHNVTRKNKRDTIAFLRRNIDENLSPINTPTPKIVKKNYKVENTVDGDKLDIRNTTKQKNLSPIDGRPKKRLELLAKWKAEKVKQKQLEKAQEKPVFKVCHVSSEFPTNFESVNRTIKSKPIVASSIKKSQFAPPNHIFKPPRSIKPIEFNVNATDTNLLNLEKTNCSPLKITKQDSTITKTNLECCSTNQIQLRGTTKILPSMSSQKEIKANINVRKNIQTADLQTDKYAKKSNKSNKVKPVKSKSNLNSEEKIPNAKIIRQKTSEKGVKSNLDDKNNTKPEIDKKIYLKTKKSVDNKVSENKKLFETKLENVLTEKRSMATCQHKNNETIVPTERCVKNNSLKNYIFLKTSKKKVAPNIGNRSLTVGADTFTTIHKEKFRKPSKRTINSTNNSLKELSNCDLSFNDPADLKCRHKTEKSLGSSSSSSTDYPVDYNDTDNSAKSTCTPNSKVNESASAVYISPFVTISRGKKLARKEYHVRSHSPESCPESNFTKFITTHSSSQAGAEYFTRKLDTEIENIERMCAEWQIYLKNPDLPDEAHSSIDVAIGQSNLLLSKKFQQFRCLLVQCQTEVYKEKPISCSDLHGFWDMMYMQVEDLLNRFNNLKALKDNDWEEILPQKQIPVKRKRGRPKKLQTKSKLKEMINTARQKTKEEQIDQKLFNGGYYEVRTPVKEKSSPNNFKPTRISSRVSLLASASKKRFSSSPGLTMMKVSQSIKQGNGLTPAKSILKSELSKSTGKKSVIFKDNLDNSQISCKTVLFSNEDKENLTSLGPAPVTSRRSARLSKLKL